MTTDVVLPWELDEWDAYVRDHPAGSVYHTSRWCRIVGEIGRYNPACLVTRNKEGRLAGILPAMEIRSRLTGNRLGTLPFSDECYPIADDKQATLALLEGALHIREDRGLEFFEMRGTPVTRQYFGETAPECVTVLPNMGFAQQSHFYNYLLPLLPDSEAVLQTFHKKSVRPTIKRSFKLGVTVRHGHGDKDLHEFYRMYCITRKRHGIPPQPVRLFERILAELDGDPLALLYLAEFEGRCIGAIIVFRFMGKTYLKYEVVDDDFRDQRPVYAMLWKSIEESAQDGDHTYDFGRTEKDNTGLAGFKSRWGTTQIELPYYFNPPGDALSVVDSSSLKYKLFTGFFRRMPTALSKRVGEKIFRHFG